MNTLVGKKIHQTQRFLEDGTRIPVTIIGVPSMKVTAIKSLEKDGYDAIQIGFGVKKKASQSVLGHVKKAQMSTAPAYIREVKLSAKNDTYSLGDSVAAETVLKPGDIITAIGTSKGKGFAGVVKRHNFRGGPKTHGQSDRHRAPGSIGQTTTPGRVYKGKRMAGRMGQDTVSVTNLVVVDVVQKGDGSSVWVKGLVPGSLNSLIRLEKTGEVKEKNYVPLLKTAEEIDEQKVAPVEDGQKQAAVEELSDTATQEVVGPTEDAEKKEEK